MKIKQRYIDIKKENIKDYFDEKAILALIKRVAGQKYCDKIVLEQIESDGFDFYEVFDKGDKVCIRANTGVSFAKGFNSYLKEICHYSVGILSTSGTLPDVPPAVGRVLKEKSAFLYRYFYNYCTFSYTYAFDTWKEWEKTLDYLLLSGYNLILNPIGIESVWKKVLEKIGYSKKDIVEFICGPAFYAWQWMMNMTGWAGGAPQWWYDFREELSGKFNQRLQSFGVAVVNAGYVGLVPDDFSKYYPDSDIKEQGEWVGEYMSPSLITPQDPNYDRLADIYYSEMRKIKGGDKVKYYSVDPFHEGGDCSKIDLKAFVTGNFNKMREHCPEAVWILQEWGEPKSYLAESMPDGGMVMVSLSADNKDPEAVDTTGAPWCYCAVNSFGGQYYLEGNAEKSLLNPFKHLDNETSNILGIGYMPESVNCCEILYSIYAENTYRAKAMEPDNFIRKYMLENYGSENEEVYKALKNVFYNIYNKKKNPSTGESGLCARPALDVVHTSMWSNAANPYNKQEDLIDYINARENRPFGERGEPPKNFSNIKSDYFSSIQNCFIQLAGLIKRDKDATRLFFYNFMVAKNVFSKMQSMFGDLDVDKYYIKKHQELCIREDQSMSDIYMCCRYYENNQPNIHFNKYLVKTWYISENKERLALTKSLFEDCEEGYEIKFPTKVYYDGVLSYYPIIVKNVDLTDEIEIQKLVWNTISFSNSDYDYLVILFAESDNKVMPQALQISKSTFESLHKCFETGDETILESITPPYPVEITDRTCLCFDELISIKEKDENPFLSYIGEMGEELWIYSKTKEILSPDKDENYLRQCLDEVEANIVKIFKEIEGKIPEHIIFFLKEHAENVINGVTFGNKEFNDFIEKCVKIEV